MSDIDAHPLRTSGQRLVELLAIVEDYGDAAFGEDGQSVPMNYARHLANMKDAQDQIDAINKDLKLRSDARAAQVEKLMEEDRLPSDGFKAGGRSFHISRQLWASPKDGNHEALTEILDALGLDEYKPKTVNSQSFSAFVREHLDPDETLPLADRLLSDNPKPLPPELWEAINATIKPTLRFPKS